MTWSEILVTFFSTFWQKVSFLRINPYGMLYMFLDQNLMGNSMKLFSMQKNVVRKLLRFWVRSNSQKCSEIDLRHWKRYLSWSYVWNRVNLPFSPPDIGPFLSNFWQKFKNAEKKMPSFLQSVASTVNPNITWGQSYWLSCRKLVCTVIWVIFGGTAFDFQKKVVFKVGT